MEREARSKWLSAALELFGAFHNEVGELIVAGVNAPRIKELLAPDRATREALSKQ